MIEAGTQIGEMTCIGCGATKPLKVNKAGCVYMFCREPVGMRDGKREDCFTRLNIGRTASEKIIKEFLKNSEEHTHGTEHIQETEQLDIEHDTAAGAGKPEARPEQPTAEHTGSHEPAPKRAGRIAAGLKNFLTGDE